MFHGAKEKSVFRGACGLVKSALPVALWYIFQDISLCTILQTPFERQELA
jgi:hypothetical protein